MKKAIKHIYDAGFVFYKLKTHKCPRCNSNLKIEYKIKIINSNSVEAKNYDFQLVDTFIVGDVEFRMSYLLCPECESSYSAKEIKIIEKT